MVKTNLKCPYCGNNVQPDDKLCPYCRKELPNAPVARKQDKHSAETRPCPNCKQLLEPTANLCDYCGKPTLFNAYGSLARRSPTAEMPGSTSPFIRTELGRRARSRALLRMDMWSLLLVAGLCVLVFNALAPTLLGSIVGWGLIVFSVAAIYWSRKPRV